jgi:protein-S-isoprenylcysteine O-methyltransferase Ste14
MNIELIFRIIFWVLLFFVIILNRIIPALRAKQTGQKILPHQKEVQHEGKTVLILRILLFIPFLTFLIFYSVYPPFMNIIHFDLPIWIRWSGTLLAFISVVLWIWSQAILDKYWSPQLQIQKEHKIITSGPYGTIRHPIYTAMFGWVIGLAILTANMGFVFMAVLTIVFLILRVPREEKMMIEQFGDEYIHYMQNTGKFFPRFI